MKSVFSVVKDYVKINDEDIENVINEVSDMIL